MCNRPECYTPEPDVVYPLCLGNGSKDCEECCLFLDFPSQTM